MRIELMFSRIFDIPIAMSGRIGQMRNRFELRLPTSMTISLIGILSLNVHAQSAVATSDSDSLLPQNVIVHITVVNRFFPGVSQETGTPAKTRPRLAASSDEECHLRE